ncbi:MAG: zinc-ribbon domain-containing protein, partial [Clostridia bacterium]|nr:zinc-ribbon domain-containing protein [Clostridia bacterium]
AAEIAALIAEADMIKIKVSELEEEIARTKNQTICPTCGAKLDLEMAFCPSCGAKQEKPEAEPAPECECDCGCCGCDDSEDTDGTEE